MEVRKCIGDLRAVYIQIFLSGISANPRHGGVITQCAVCNIIAGRIMMYIRKSESVAIFESVVSVVWKLMFGSKKGRKSPFGLWFFLKARVERGVDFGT
jgi:hypothetical protein